MLFSVFRVVQPSRLLIQETFHHPKKIPCAHSGCSPLPLPQPQTTLICFLFLWIRLFWTFPVKRILQYVAFCAWLLSLRMVSSRLVCAVACQPCSFLWSNAVPSHRETPAVVRSSVCSRFLLPGRCGHSHVGVSGDMCSHFSLVCTWQVVGGGVG